jgi:manganese/zinc/iron transport system substrate-binding protein
MRHLIFLLLSAVLLAGCGQAAPAAEAPAGPAAIEANPELAGRPIRAVATIGMIGDIVENVGGERVEVQSLMGPGIDPHLYKASEGDVAKLDQADVIFYNGLHLEAGMGGVLERMAEGGRAAVAVTNGIDRALLNAPPEFQGAYDPHVWFDVALWMSAVEYVRDTLVSLDPPSAELYQANATSYLGQLSELDSYVKAAAATIPADRRALITAHDAFNYFGQAYGLEVRGLQGISTESEASTADVRDLVAFIVERKIPAIFIESSVPQRTVEAVQAAVRDQGLDLQIGGQLFSDAMGNPGTPEGTYIGMVRHNIDTIVAALAQ